MKRNSIVKILSITAIVLSVIGMILSTTVFLLRTQDANEPDVIEEPDSAAEMYTDVIDDIYGYSPDCDTDGDTLNDYEEHYTYGTDIAAPDTDGDALYDNREIELGTDPLKADTDGDGINDSTELRAGTDPLKRDANKKFEYTAQSDDNVASFVLKGNASVYNAAIEIFDAPGLSNIPGVVSDAYWVYTDSNNEGILSIAHTVTDDISIYKIENTSELKKIQSDREQVDGQWHITATVGNGKYVLGMCSALDDYIGNTEAIDVFLLIDDSGSMYNEAMNGAGNDPEYKRVDMCQQLVERAPDSIRFGLATFTADYMEKSGITEDRDVILDGVQSIAALTYAEKEAQFNGTYIATSLWYALENFSADSKHRQVVVLLTDGTTTEGSSIWDWFRDNKSIESALEKANERNVTVITVALGRDVDVEYLANIKQQTSGAYIHANSADAMDSLYEAILSAVTYNFTDNNKDGENDSILLADSGFRPERDGFSFKNAIVKVGDIMSPGVCYGMSTFSSLYYQEKLPLSLDNMNITDWEQAWLRIIAKFSGVNVLEWQVPGFSAADYEAASFSLNEGGTQLDYSIPLREWSSWETDKNTEIFLWSYDSEMYDENKMYTDKAYETFATTETVQPTEYEMTNDQGEVVEVVNLPMIVIDGDEVSADAKKAGALLKIIMRMQFLQHDNGISDVEYDFVKDFDLIKTSLESGIPLIINLPTHAMNACSLRQDIDNPNLYYVDLYDNRQPDQMLTATVQIQKNELNKDVAFFTFRNDHDAMTFTDIRL